MGQSREERSQIRQCYGAVHFCVWSDIDLLYPYLSLKKCASYSIVNQCIQGKEREDYIHWLLSSIGQIFCPQGTNFPILLVCASSGWGDLISQALAWAVEAMNSGYRHWKETHTQTHGDKPHCRKFQKIEAKERLISMR